VGAALLAGESGNGAPSSDIETVFSRNLSEDGDRVFFQTPDPLTAADSNMVTDVYEWEAKGEGSCVTEAQDGGCLFLISGGTNKDQSYFLDASADGDDAFFFTREALVATDTDSNVDVYDARVDGLVEPLKPHSCPEGEEWSSVAERCQEPPCESEETCKAPPTEKPGESFPATAAFTGPGNLVSPPTETPSVTKPTKKKLTRAQELTAALKACRKETSAKKRASCEKAARHKYTPAKKKKG
jgi:hypothetical protein